MGLPIDRMLKDADEAWRIRESNPNRIGALLGDLSCHVKALADALERAESERDSWRARLWNEVRDRYARELGDGIGDDTQAAALADAACARVGRSIREANR